MPSYYELLGVSSKASGEEIRKAYLQLAHKYHPDAGGSKKDEEKLKEINAAYHCLKNPKKRLQYDLGILCPHGVSPPSGSAQSKKRASAHKSSYTGSSRARPRQRASAGTGPSSSRARYTSQGGGRSQTRARRAASGAGPAGFSGNTAHARSYRPGANSTSTAFHDNLRNIRFGEAAGDDEKVMVGDPMHDVFWVVYRAVSAVCLFLILTLCIWAMGGAGVLPGIVIGILAGEALGYLAVSSLAVVLQIMGWWRPSERPQGNAEFEMGWMDADDE
ncbi:MAG: J domain-containing protein [Candidatus Hydrogenedentota bacterium]